MILFDGVDSIGSKKRKNQFCKIVLPIRENPCIIYNCKSTEINNGYSDWSSATKDYESPVAGG